MPEDPGGLGAQALRQRVRRRAAGGAPEVPAEVGFGEFVDTGVLLGARPHWRIDKCSKQNHFCRVNCVLGTRYGVLNVVNDPRGVKACAQYGDSYLVLGAAARARVPRRGIAKNWAPLLICRQREGWSAKISGKCTFGANW